MLFRKAEGIEDHIQDEADQRSSVNVGIISDQLRSDTIEVDEDVE